VLITNGLSITGATGTLDLWNNDMIVQATHDTRDNTFNYIRQQVENARFLGWGITTSEPALIQSFWPDYGPRWQNLLGLAVVLNDSGGTALFYEFDGQPVNTSSILVKYTWIGDLNLDGIVDDKDLAAFNPSGSGWTSGNVDQNGIVNLDDLYLIQGAYNFIWNNRPEIFSDPSQMVIQAHITDPVPEPGGLSLLVIGAATLALRRGRQGS
jgi:hypothetical protein